MSFLKRISIIFVISIVGNAIVNLIFGWMHNKKNNFFDIGEMVRAYILMIIIFEGIVYINNRLDKKYSWTSSPYKRFRLEILLITSWVIVVFNLILSTVTSIFFEGNFSIIELLVINGCALTIILISILTYRVRYFFKLWKNFSSKSFNNNVSSIKVRIGTKLVLVPTSEINFFVSIDKITYLINSDNNKYIYDKSLDKTIKKLDNKYFFRVNRQFIVHRSSIKTYQSSSNGKILVWIKQSKELNQPLTISRLKAADFRKWIKLI